MGRFAFIVEFALKLYAFLTKAAYEKGYADGVAAANLLASDEQRIRINAAKAARADAEHIDAGGVPDPRQRD